MPDFKIKTPDGRTVTVRGDRQYSTTSSCLPGPLQRGNLGKIAASARETPPRGAGRPHGTPPRSVRPACNTARVPHAVANETGGLGRPSSPLYTLSTWGRGPLGK